MVVWTGHLPARGLLTITGANVSTGSLSGTFPGNPIAIEIYPAEISAAGLTVFTSDPRYASSTTIPTPRGTATFVFDPRHATDISVFEPPGAQNQWKRLVMSIRNTKISACVVAWSLEKAPPL
jgi:hypothetical protein